MLTCSFIIIEHCDAIKKPRLGLRSFRHAFDEADDTQQQHSSKQKHRHRSSSDSSLLQPLTRIDSKSRKEESKLHPDPRERFVSHPTKKRKAASSDSTSLAGSNARPEIFERRDRHKTREDRYEPKKKKHKSEKRDKERKPRKTREKKGDKKKAEKKAGEKLMHNFSSKKVSQDRLTVSNSS